MEDMRHRVMVVADHAVLADLLAAVIAGEEDLVCAGVAGDGPAALTLAERVHPDAVLLDAVLPCGDGIELIAPLKRICAAARVIVLTGRPRADGERLAFAAGAAGYLGRTASLAEVLAAIRHAPVGQPAPSNLPYEPAPSQPGPPFFRRSLSPREREVLALLAEGRHVNQIAAGLGLSVNTTRDYVKSVLKKMGAHSQLEAVTRAAVEGLVRVGR